MNESSRPSADHGGGSGPITLARVLDLPAVRSVRPSPTRVDLTALVAFCETRRAQVHGHPGAEEARLAGKSGTHFSL